MKTIVCITLILYILSSIAFLLRLKSDKPAKVSITLAMLGWVFNLILLAIRAKITSGLPVRNGYDFLVIFTFLTVSMYLIYLLYVGNNAAKRAGGPVMIIAALLFLAVFLFTPAQSSVPTPLAPALKSPWLTIHVLTAAIAYSGFALAAGLAIVHLANTTHGRSVYQVVRLSFAFLSLSIVFGAVWAEQAWGSYWSWDPKETWALITWIIYGAYLHLSHKAGWQGKPANLLAFAGFIIVLFTFFGVNYLFNGMHSYS